MIAMFIRIATENSRKNSFHRTLLAKSNQSVNTFLRTMFALIIRFLVYLQRVCRHVLLIDDIAIDDKAHDERE